MTISLLNVASGCSWEFGVDWLEVPSECVEQVLKRYGPELVATAQKLNKPFQIKWGNGTSDRLSISPKISELALMNSDMTNSTTIITATRNGQPHLVDATRRQVLEFIENQREAGKVVVVTSQITNRCIDIQNIDPSRGIFAHSSQWHGVNFLELWRESMPQFFDLLNRLDSDGIIEGFTYDLLRMDGSKGRYQKDYYLANNFLPGEPVRISVSNRDEWELIRPAIA
ncbi:MAG: hypothetical protein ACOVOV_01330 [Dolichospermum sp.]